MEILKEWVTAEAPLQKIPLEEQIAIMSDIDSKIVSVKGGGVFSITHSLLATVSFLMLLNMLLECYLRSIYILTKSNNLFL